ncbi:MAG: hypothetical protein AB1568_12360 [Thermodesulfobacteriota bacterium]
MESSFLLSPESRLPKWFTIPYEMNRNDFFVKMELHTTPNGLKDVFKLYQKGKLFCIEKHTITESDQPKIKAIQPQEQVTKKTYPKYKVITINGVTDIVVLRKMEPFFYMENDPAVWEKLGVPLSNE